MKGGGVLFSQRFFSEEAKNLWNMLMFQWYSANYSIPKMSCKSPPPPTYCFLFLIDTSWLLAFCTSFHQHPNNKDHQRMIVDPMFMIVHNLRSLVTAVPQTVVTHLNLVKFTWKYLNSPEFNLTYLTLPKFKKTYLNLPEFN